MSGLELRGTPKFTVGCTLGPYSDEESLEKELLHAKKKIEAGASFIITPPVFDMDRFTSFIDKAKDLNVPIIPKVFLLKTVGIARYMATYEPGVFISEEMSEHRVIKEGHTPLGDDFGGIDIYHCRCRFLHGGRVGHDAGIRRYCRMDGGVFS